MELKQLSKETIDLIREDLTAEFKTEQERWGVLHESDYVFYMLSEEELKAYDQDIPTGGGYDWSVFDDITGPSPYKD